MIRYYFCLFKVWQHKYCIFFLYSIVKYVHFYIASQSGILYGLWDWEFQNSDHLLWSTHYIQSLSNLLAERGPQSADLHLRRV